MIAFAAPILALVLTIALIAWMLIAGLRTPLDHPNDRSLHQRPVPRSGGIAIMVGIAAAFALASAPRPVLWLAAFLTVISWLDDWRGLGAGARILAHLAAASAFAWFALSDLPWMLLLPAVIGIVWLINLYNFMDGSDGLAGGMTLIGFAFLGMAAWNGGEMRLALAAFSIAASAAGFLLFNFHPARIFMGDSGSIPIGFLAAAIGILGWREAIWPAWFPFVVFSPFIVDATLTLAKRLLRRERVWEAHRSHYYQRLVRMGWGHRGTALAEYALMALCGCAGLWAMGRTAHWQFAAVLGIACLYAVLAVRVDIAWRQHNDLEDR